MRPRTKLQLRVVNLSSQLPNIESLMIDWAKNECLKHIGYATKSRFPLLALGGAHHAHRPVRRTVVGAAHGDHFGASGIAFGQFESPLDRLIDAYYSESCRRPPRRPS